MFNWFKKIFSKTSAEDEEGEKTYEAQTYEEAIMQNAMRALKTGKPVVGNWDGEHLTNRVVQSKEK